MQIICTVDIRTRELALEDVTIAAFDHLVDDILFDVEPIDGFELDTSTIKIAAVGPLGEQHDYEIDPSTVTVDEETGNINFIWSIPVGVTAMPLSSFKINDIKKITFAVCAEIVSGDNLVKAWHSNDGTIKVKAHLEPESGGGEDPSEEATNAQKIGRLQTDVAVVQRVVAAVAGGTPTVVDAKAGMTDTNKIYVLSTDGKWYYHDGTTWTVGGTYGGAMTSTTFTEHGVPADDFAVGQALAGKADADDVTAVQTALAEKADTADMAAVSTSLNGISLGVDPITGYLYVYVNGKKQGTGIDIGAEGIDVSSAVEWYRQPIKSALAYVDNLGTDEWVHHVVVADSHYNARFEDLKEQYPTSPDEGIYQMMYNYNHPGAIVKLLMSTGYFDKFIDLGDITDKGNTKQLDIAIEQVGDLNGQMLYCMGNHEVSGANEITGLLYDAFMSELDPNVITYDPNFVSDTYMDSNYVYKDTENKIAYVHFAYYRRTSEANMISWLWDVTSQIEDGWTIFLMSHQPELGTNLLACLQGIMNFTSLRKGFFLAGHNHADSLVDLGGFTRIQFDNDACFNEAERVKDTTFEQAVSIISIGTGTNNAVKVYRIGAYADTFESTAPMIWDTQMTYNEFGSTFQAQLNTGGQLEQVGTSTYRLLRKWFPVLPSTYYYIYDSRQFDKTATSGRTLNYGQFSAQKLPSFISGSRVATAPEVHELYVRKIYTKATSNYMIIGANNEERASHLAMSTEPPRYDISIDDVTWVHGSMNGVGIPSYSDSATTYLSDIPILVDPSSTYVLDNPDVTTVSVAIGRAKGPCAINAVNSTRDAISRATGSSLPFTFTTTADTNYVYVQFSGSVTEGWTLTKVES